MSLPDPLSINNNAGHVFDADKIFTNENNRSVFRHSAGGNTETWSFAQVSTKTRKRILCRYDFTGTPDGITGIRPTQSVNMTLDMPLDGPNAYLGSNIESLTATTQAVLTRLVNGEL